MHVISVKQAIVVGISVKIEGILESSFSVLILVIQVFYSLYSIGLYVCSISNKLTPKQS